MKKTLALFIGSDITSHLIAQRAIRSLIQTDMDFMLIYPEQDIPGGRARPGYEEFLFYERTFFHKHLFPLLDERIYSPLNISFTPEGLRHEYPKRVRVLRISDINSPEILSILKGAEVTIGVSIRWYQKFGPSIISYFGSLSERGGLFNLHPGILPQYRGVITFIRALSAGDSDAGFTLHEINSKWDAGPIIGYSKYPLDRELSLIGNMCAHVPTATELLVSGIEQILNHQHLSYTPQDENESQYYTFPSQEELLTLRANGIFLSNINDIKNVVRENFQSASKDCKSLIELHRYSF